ncbi:MAG TPA: hypothetical protein PKY56_01670 [Candidatus Kapabacteria bacterium]|nr:hypothetical protein [Candidatus Kapabacteria bacterium]HPO63641.1 hypothetical protein [Candidatus Kapabacteria bacterium]
MMSNNSSSMSNITSNDLNSARFTTIRFEEININMNGASLNYLIGRQRRMNSTEVVAKEATRESKVDNNREREKIKKEIAKRAVKERRKAEMRKEELQDDENKKEAKKEINDEETAEKVKFEQPEKKEYKSTMEVKKVRFVEKDGKLSPIDPNKSEITNNNVKDYDKDGYVTSEENQSEQSYFVSNDNQIDLSYITDSYSSYDVVI